MRPGAQKGVLCLSKFVDSVRFYGGINMTGPRSTLQNINSSLPSVIREVQE